MSIDLVFLKTGRIVHRMPCDDIDIRHLAQLIRDKVIECPVDFDAYDTRRRGERHKTYRMENESQQICEYVRRVNKMVDRHRAFLESTEDLINLIDLGKRLIVIAEQIERESDDGR